MGLKLVLDELTIQLGSRGGTQNLTFLTLSPPRESAQTLSNPLKWKILKKRILPHRPRALISLSLLARAPCTMLAGRIPVKIESSINNSLRRRSGSFVERSNLCERRKKRDEETRRGKKRVFEAFIARLVGVFHSISRLVALGCLEDFFQFFMLRFVCVDAIQTSADFV